MIDIEHALSVRFPKFARSPNLLRKPALGLLKRLVHEQEINTFLAENADARGFDWIDRVFERFHFSYRSSARERNNIPASGRLLVIANHPIGSLDGLALLRLIGEVRQDVRIVANEMLCHFRELQPLLVPVDVFSGTGTLGSCRKVLAELEAERAVIVFPAGEVSRISASGVKDPQWRGGFLHFARKAQTPLLPVRIEARNSLLFYGASMLYKPAGTVLLSDEMFKHQFNTISFHVGEVIPYHKLFPTGITDRRLVKRLRKHLYKLGRQHVPVFETERTVAHPESRQLLQKELREARLLGTTRDHMQIYLADWQQDSALLREIGRLRELTFRRVGEGSGKRRDLDRFDTQYRHLVLWDRDALEIAGAYRIGECATLINRFGAQGLYTQSLYEFGPAFMAQLEYGIELGRSFVNPGYQGRACLDYLWQGIGAYLAHHPQVRYLFGPVSMSASYPKALMEELVYFFTRYHGVPESPVLARMPFDIDAGRLAALAQLYAGLDAESALDQLQHSFEAHGCRIPVLFRQYLSLFEPGGFKALVFSRDPDFADCLDGLCLADLHLLKSTKRARYLSGRHA